ncbi:MAG: hypothetical protein KA184_03535 [Candidatus Hydrogenedentes bacterium]|nr:hypothetical protein [Candidatus Hydrogenedentota bacterium]
MLHAPWKRIALLALLLLAGALTAGILAAKHQLDGVRAVLEERIASRFGARFNARSVSVDGLSALLFEDVETWAAAPGGWDARLRIPSCRVVINLTDLLSGTVSMQRIEVDGAHLTLSPSSPPADGQAAPARRDLSAAAGAAFRVVGERCRLELHGLGNVSDIVLDDVSFDISRLSNATDIAAKVRGALRSPLAGPAPAFRIDARYASPEDFSVRAECGAITQAAARALSPSVPDLLRSGTASANLRADGYPNRVMMLHVQVLFDQVALHKQPAFLPAMSGSMALMANYDTQRKELTLESALLNAWDLTGRVDGRVSFAQARPEVDISLAVDDVPLTEALADTLPFRLENVGELAFDIEQPGAVRVHVAGTLPDAAITAEVQLGAGTFTFQPDRETLPTATLSLGGATLAWSSQAGLAGGSASIINGEVFHEKAGVRAQHIAGQLQIGDGILTVDPINLELTGNPFFGRVRYVIAEKRGSFEAQGTLSDIENTPLGKGIKETEIAGSATARCTGSFEPDHYVLDLAVDATQAAIEHDWWFYKRPGVGATLQGVNVDVVPRKRARISGSFALGTSTGNATIEMGYRNGRYRLMEVRAKSDHIDVTEVGPCIRVPYTFSGGLGTAGFFTWNRVNDIPDGAIIEVGGQFDRIALLPDGSEKTIQAGDAFVHVTLDNSRPDNRTSQLHITVGEGHIPPFGETWMLPLRTDPVLLAKYPDKPRSWTFNAAVDHLVAPPWDGRQFKAAGAFDDDRVQLTSFSAQVGEGAVEGAYTFEKAENIGRLTAQWRDIPASVLIDHVHLPRILDGRVTGGITYEMDRDDPGTLAGNGEFHFREGRFSADFLFAQFQEFLQGNMTSLPPSLHFSELDFDLQLKGDHVSTNNMRLDSEGITITGEGGLVLGADMEYLINVVIAPEVASRMPVFSDYFNVEGHQLSQNDLALTFRITGPTFNPSSQVVGLPSVGVTVVSGAAELGTEAFRVLDTPRQILIDLFKIGGAIVGAGR